MYTIRVVDEHKMLKFRTTSTRYRVTFRDLEVRNLPNILKSLQKRCRYVDLEQMMKDKKCFIRINNNDDLCCARDLVTAKARLDNHEQWNSIRQGRNIQNTLAMKLHKMAGVPLRRCDLKDIKSFQHVLQGYQINVSSKESFNALVYEGPKAEKKIYLYLHDGHFDVITKRAGFFNKNYFCTKCNRGYDHKEKHSCNNTCHCCRKMHDDEEIIDWIFFEDCNRYFKGSTCFDIHKEETASGRNTCKTYFACKKCTQTVNMSMHKKPHICGEKFCSICKASVEPEHQCYIKPEDTEEEEEDRSTNDSDSDANDVKQKMKYIFLDFECTQDTMLQCDGGFYPEEMSGKCRNCNESRCGTFKHTPNLCVSHTVCESCMHLDINSDSFCIHCGKNERVFNGVDTRNDFCKWLFSDDNLGATVFCHNFKGYDSYPIMSYLYENAILPIVIKNGSKFMSIQVPQCKLKFIDSINFLPTMAL